VKSVVAEVRKLAGQVAQGPTTAFMESKRLIGRIRDEKLGLPEVLAAEAKAQGVAGRTTDYREGITAFQEKRTPKFTGR
jgi:2-(1,2-epoxy-1,2-dihydrophenyl)acetyl-CoA isomerase